MESIEDNYRRIELIDVATVISEDIEEDDLDFDNIVGRNLIIEPSHVYLTLGKKSKKEYEKFLDNKIKENLGLFFYADVSSNCLYFECLIGSKTNSKTKYKLKKLLYSLENEKCPSCGERITIKPYGTSSVRIMGDTDICQKYLIYCPNCKGIFGTLGFKATDIVKKLFSSGKYFFRSLKSVHSGKTENGIEFNSNFDSIYRC
jgi:hypothetical protein